MSTNRDPMKVAFPVLMYEQERVVAKKREDGRVPIWYAKDFTQDFVLGVIVAAIKEDRQLTKEQWLRVADGIRNAIDGDMNPVSRQRLLAIVKAIEKHVEDPKEE